MHILRLVLVPVLLLGCSREAFRTGPFPLLAGGFGLSTHIPTGTTIQDNFSREFELLMNNNAGVKLLRRDFLWPEIESLKGKFSFAAYDRVVDEAETYDQEFIGLLTYAPDWARKSPGNDSSIDPEDFAAFVSVTVAHFKGRIARWEIWNEPNLPLFWKPEPDPQAYGVLLKAAYKAAKAADPSCTVAFGGMSSDLLLFQKTWGFLEKVYEAHPDIGAYYDAMAFHPYTFFQLSSPEEETIQGNTIRMIKSLKEIMAGHGDGNKPVWITELGWPAGPGAPAYSYPPNVTYREQAAWLVRSFLLAISQGVDILCWYDFIDGDGSAQPSSENYFGLVSFDRTPKDSYAAYTTMTRVLGPLHFEKDLRASLNLAAGEYGFLFRSDSGNSEVMTLWKAGKGLSSTVEIHVPGPVKKIDLLGRESVLTPAEGGVAVTVSNDPVYLVRE